MGNPHFMLRGALVGLVPLQSTDVDVLYRWLNDPKVRMAAGDQTWRPAYSLDQVQELIGERLSQASRFDLVSVDLTDGRPLGLLEITHLHPMSDSARIGMVWGEEENEDLMEESLILALGYAFNSQSLHRVWARVPSSNQTVINIYQRAGFRVEGVLREDHFRGGVWRDSVLLSLLSMEVRSC